jgi:hypothetical protein
MSIFTGRNDRGISPWAGVFINPENDNEWSWEPYNSIQAKESRDYNEIETYMAINYLDFALIMEQIKTKVCKLPLRLRNLLYNTNFLTYTIN